MVSKRTCRLTARLCSGIAIFVCLFLCFCVRTFSAILLLYMVMSDIALSGLFWSLVSSFRSFSLTLPSSAMRLTSLIWCVNVYVQMCSYVYVCLYVSVCVFVCLCMRVCVHMCWYWRWPLSLLCTCVSSHHERDTSFLNNNYTSDWTTFLYRGPLTVKKYVQACSGMKKTSPAIMAGECRNCRS